MKGKGSGAEAPGSFLRGNLISLSGRNSAIIGLFANERDEEMTTDMTEGKIIPQLTAFTIPLVLGNLFQLTYNAADSVIVGKFVGDEALAAVGTAGPVMNMIILFISGMCMGAGILMSTQYGAKKYDQLERQISTTMLGGLVFSAVVALLLIVLAYPLLGLLQVPDDIVHSAAVYLRIIFVGLIFTFIYNFFSNTLRALGDSRVPLYFLIISAFLNIVLDLLFVVVIRWGVAGSAVATMLSEALCCLFCLIYIKKKVPLLCLGKKWRVFDASILWRTFTYGITSALQQMCIQLGKICVQTIVNVQGVAFIAAYTAINRVDDFALTPQGNISHAATTFMAQNRGAGKISRMKSGEDQPDEERLPGFDPAADHLFSGGLSGCICAGPSDHAALCKRRIGRSDHSWHIISEADCAHVPDACSHQCDPGILPGDG